MLRNRTEKVWSLWLKDSKEEALKREAQGRLWTVLDVELRSLDFDFERVFGKITSKN